MTDHRLVALNQHVPKQTQWLWPSLIPCGGITLMEGDPGGGKSTLLYDIAARVTTGRPMCHCTEHLPPAPVIVLQAEDTWDTMRRNLAAAGADLSKILLFEKQDSSGGGEVRLPEDTESLAQEAEKSGAQLVIVDPISAYASINLNNEQAVRRLTQPLVALADRIGAAIVLVRHLTKSSGGNPLCQGAGSIALIAACRSALLVAPDPGNPEHRVVAQIKANLTARAPSLSFRPVPKDQGVATEWLGQSEYSATQLLEANRAQSRGELRDAIYVLYSILGDGPVTAKEVKQRAAAAGIADRTLRRAKDVLRVISQRRGFGKGSTFWWVLPAGNEVVIQLQQRDLDVLMDRLCSTEQEDTSDGNRRDSGGSDHKDHENPGSAGTTSDE